MKAVQSFSDTEASCVVLCGDFNAEPNTTTYNMVTTGGPGDHEGSMEEVKTRLDDYWVWIFFLSSLV